MASAEGGNRAPRVGLYLAVVQFFFAIGWVVYAAYLPQLAQQAGRRFLFEATVLDSAPVFSLFRETLPAVKLRGFSGVLNFIKCTHDLSFPCVYF